MPSTGFGVHVAPLRDEAFAAGFRAEAFFAAGFFAPFFGAAFFFAMRGSLHQRLSDGQPRRRGKAGGMMRSTVAPSQRQLGTCVQ